MAARVPEPRVLLCLAALLARWVAAGKGRDLEGKVEFCQATVGRRESQGLNSLRLLRTRWRLPRPRSRRGWVLSFLLAALRSLQKGIFPGAGARWRVRYLHALGAAGRQGCKGLRGGDGKIAEIEDGNFETEKIKRHVEGGKCF